MKADETDAPRRTTDMDRRGFLRNVGLAGLAMGGVSLAGCQSHQSGMGMGGGGYGHGAQGKGTGGPIPVAPSIDPQTANITAVVETPDALGRELASARRGGPYEPGREPIIWIPEGAQIDASGRDFTIEYATVASSRGLNGGVGGMLYTSSQGSRSASYRGGSHSNGFIDVLRQGRVSGVRLRGPHFDYWDDPNWPGFIPFAPQSSRSARDAWRGERHARAITVRDSSGRVDNCEIWGWGTQGIAVGSKDDVADCAIHFNAIHNCMMTSYGYPIEVFRGHPDVYRCWFDAYRHAIAGYGYGDGGYFARQCTFGQHASGHIIDMHRIGENHRSGASSDPTSDNWRYLAGGRIELTGCSVVATNVIPDYEDGGGSPLRMCRIRGIPRQEVHFRGNDFAHDEGPSSSSVIEQSPIPSGFTTNDLGLHRVYFEGNNWAIDFDGDGEPGAAFGAPIRPAGTGQ